MEEIALSRVLTALSYALDLTEGHPRGHTARSCLIGMWIARAVGMAPHEQSDLFYALLLKDAGCSSNATRVHQLFGGTDHVVKRGVWLRDWRRLREQIAYALEHVEPDGSLVQRLRKFAGLAAIGPRGAKELFQIRCDRGAEIAMAIGFPADVASAIRAMDEHWDGWGYAKGLRRDEIPLAARIINLAQVIESSRPSGRRLPRWQWLAIAGAAGSTLRLFARAAHSSATPNSGGRCPAPIWKGQWPPRNLSRRQCRPTATGSTGSLAPLRG